LVLLTDSAAMLYVAGLLFVDGRRGEDGQRERWLGQRVRESKAAREWSLPSPPKAHTITTSRATNASQSVVLTMG
jgi:hypothetical protein